MPEGSCSSSNDVPMDEESSHLSAASINSTERAPSATPSDSSDRRPVSLISTLSSGSGSSRDDSLAPPPSTQSSDIDLDLSPAEGTAEAEVGSWPRPEPPQRGRGLGLIKNNNKEAKPSPGSSRRQQTSPFINRSMAPNPELTYLDRVVMEIIETERMYVRDLRMIVEDYLAHIIDQCDLSIRPEQVCALFGNIEDIYEFNSELLQALDLCDNDPVAVARCFVMKSEYFEIYTQYCTNYPNSVAALTECMRNKTLSKFFRERQGSLKRSLPLGSYLLKPVQRILKYHLLLQEIAKHFDPEEEGYEVVEEAIYTMTGVAWYINDMKRKHEHAVRLQEVQSLLLNWKGPDLTTFGELVLEGTFKVHRAKNERTLFLFERMLLITKRRGEHYVHKTHISCSTLMLIESAKDSLSFSVTHYKHPKQPHTVQAKTVEEKKLWAHHITRIILENHHAFIPQKAKDAILEMNPTYPPRYRYSPERLKKAPSSLSDEFSGNGRQGRRQSEPNKHTMKSSRAVLKEAEGGGVSSNRGNEQPPEEDKPGGPEPACEPLNESTESTDEQPQEEASESEQDPEQEPSSGPEGLVMLSPGISESPQRSEEPTHERDPEPTENPLSATPDSDSKTFSSEESSEDEEDVKEAEEEGGKANSILPSSVLDRASAIAQHFTNSIKRGSLVQDSPSQWVPSRTGSSLSLSAETPDRPLQLNSVSSEPAENFGMTDLTLLSPREDSLFDTNQGIRRRRDSILSKQEQLLISKIKSYYDYAENQSPTFKLQRRESLTYIPNGLVRTSVSRFNSIPKDETIQTSSAESNLASATDTQGHMVSSDSLDSLKSDLRSTDPEDALESQWSTSQSVQDNQSEEEEFRPSSEMIKIWQTMEQEVTGSQMEDKQQEQPKEGPRNSRATIVSLPDPTKAKNKGDDQETGDFRHRVSSESQTGSLKDSQKVFGEEAVKFRAPVPRVAQLKAEAELEMPHEDDVDKTQSKVLHLARQYSQRIKTTRPVLRQRSQGILTGKKILPCVVEEESAGKPKLTLPVVSNNQAASLPLSPVDQSRALSPDSLNVVFPGRAHSCSPLRPSQSSSTEGFNWPDVRELRSKYCDLGQSQKNPVSRTRSIPDQLFEGGMRRHSSFSSSLLLPDGVSREVPLSKLGGSWDTSTEERRKRLLRANSLDPGLGGVQMTRLQKLQEQAALSDCYYIAAEAQLPHDPEHRVIVMEKLPEPDPEPEPEPEPELEPEPEPEPAERAKEAKEEEDNYVQIRSPTSREKISIMAVIDRCRVYQESEEYKQRAEGKVKTEPARPQELDATTASLNEEDESQKTSSSSGQKKGSSHQSIVKNLREKFQKLS